MIHLGSRPGQALGHDRSVEDVVNIANQEDAHAIAMTSYQGGCLD